VPSAGADGCAGSGRMSSATPWWCVDSDPRAVAPVAGPEAPKYAMEARKICILGDFAVGKTSLVSRFVRNQFSRKYLTTIGVRVDVKEVALPDGTPYKLAVWDLAGTDTPTSLFLRYLRGSSGYLLVADGTRADTLDRALELREAIESHLSVLPFVGLINKVDLAGQQEIDAARLALLRDANETWLECSALDGTNVEQAFGLLLGAMVASA